MKKFFLILTTATICSLSATAQTATTDPGVVINGIKWATRNVGAPGTFVDNPEEKGMLYQWNRKVGWSVTDPAVSTDRSEWDNEWKGNGSKTWKAANNVCPPGWRVPKPSEFLNLSSVKSEWELVNGNRCRRFGKDANSIILPAAGYRERVRGNLNSVNIYGCYWSNKIQSRYSVYYATFNSTGVSPMKDEYFDCGLSVRCVAEE